MSSTSASGQATGVHFGLYASHDFQPFYVTTALAYSRFDGNATRVIAGIGNTETEKSSAVASQLASRVEVGRAFDVGQFQGSQLAVTPFAALQPSHLWTPGDSEWSVAQSGSTGVFALNYQPQYTASLPTFLGAQLDGQTEINGRPLKAWLRAAWVHEFMHQPQRDGRLHRVAGQQLHRRRRARRQRRRPSRPGVRYAIGSQTSLYANANVELSGRGQSLAGTSACASPGSLPGAISWVFTASRR